MQSLVFNIVPISPVAIYVVDEFRSLSQRPPPRHLDSVPSTVNEDRCTFQFDDIKGTVDPPVPLRRGAWKFEGVDAKKW